MNTPVPAPKTKIPQEALLHERMEHLNGIVHNLLGIGLILSILMMVVGIILQLLSGGHLPTVMILPSQMIASLLAFQPTGFLSLGLLLLIATPVVRVVASVIIYASNRDWRYTLVTLTVLVIITLSVLIGKG
jgi:uncharacterized membrane protein